MATGRLDSPAGYRLCPADPGTQRRAGRKPAAAGAAVGGADLPPGGPRPRVHRPGHATGRCRPYPGAAAGRTDPYRFVRSRGGQPARALSTGTAVTGTANRLPRSPAGFPRCERWLGTDPAGAERHPAVPATVLAL